MARRTRGQWWSLQTSNLRRPATRRRPVFPHSRRLRIEPLEERRLLAITVNTLIDVVANDGLTTLREAIALAPNGDAINFAASLTSGGSATIQLTNVGHAGEIVINKDLTIIGPGAGLLTIKAYAGSAAAGDGSRIFNVDDGTATIRGVYIEGLTLSGGDLNGKGGAIFLNESLAIFSSVFSNNATLDVNGNNGGAIYNNNAVLGVTDSTFANNHAGDGGGAIFSSGFGATTTIAGSTLSGNTARFSGGAIFKQQGLLTLVNDTISGNSGGYAGGGLFNQFGTARLEHVTITLNTAPDSMGSGIASYRQDAVQVLKTFTELYSTIVAGNAHDDDVAVVLGAANSFVSDNYNLIGHGSGDTAFGESGDRSSFSGSLGLGPLANNGGPTRTHALLSGSLAINAGDPTAVAGAGGVPTTDQRSSSFPRVFGARIDIGAYEYQQLETAVVDTVEDEEDGIGGFGDLSLREALRFADVITFDLPSASVILLTRGELTIAGSVSIQGPGAENLVIDASGNDPTPLLNDGNGSRVFNIGDGSPGTQIDVSISGLMLTGGDITGDGGAIRNEENLTITSSTISFNSTGDGADNLTGNGGHGGDGGGIWNSGTVSLAGSSISFNSTGHGGDGKFDNDGRGGDGGGIWSSGAVTVTGSAISLNSTGDGGGVEHIVSGGWGGGIWNSGISTITGTTISFNVSGDGYSGNSLGGGGGIFNSGNITLSGSTVSGNSAGVVIRSTGGGILNLGTATLINAVISGNTGGWGGGIENAGGGSGGGDLMVIRSSISGNTAIGRLVDFTFGGGIESRHGNTTVTDSTINGNSSSGGGGGIMEDGSGYLTLTGSTISGNTATTNGGGLYINFSTANILHTTVANNTAAVGSGVALQYSLTDVNSSIISGNPGDDIDVLMIFPNTLQSLGYNLVGSGNALISFNQPGDIIGFSPMLGPLANNGGPTLTHRPLPGSPAIDAGYAFAIPGFFGTPLYDQRGAPFSRIFNGDGIGTARIDIGAFEFVPSAMVPALFGDYNRNGVVDLADYAVWRKSLTNTVAAYTGADGSGNAIVGPEDYSIWRAHFGQTVPASGAGGIEQGAGSETVEATRLAEPVARGAVLYAGSSLTSHSRPAAGATVVNHERPAARATLQPQDDALLAWLATRVDRPRDAEVGADGPVAEPVVDGAPDGPFDTLDVVFARLGTKC